MLGFFSPFIWHSTVLFTGLHCCIVPSLGVVITTFLSIILSLNIHMLHNASVYVHGKTTTGSRFQCTLYDCNAYNLWDLCIRTCHLKTNVVTIIVLLPTQNDWNKHTGNFLGFFYYYYFIFYLPYIAQLINFSHWVTKGQEYISLSKKCSLLLCFNLVMPTI